MALTQQDIQDISSLFNKGLSEIIIPYVDTVFSELRNDTNENIQGLHDQIIDTQKMIYDYFKLAATQTQFQDHETRISRLEKAA